MINVNKSCNYCPEYAEIEFGIKSGFVEIV